MSIKERIRQLEDKVDRIERAVCGQTIEIKCPKYEVNINDPEIIGNVMRWDGKDYLDADFVPDDNKARVFLNKCDKKWTFFEMVEITDALARMRTDDQPIWVMVKDFLQDYERLRRLVAVEPKGDFVFKALHDGSFTSDWRYCRLANIDDLKKAGIR